MNIYIYSFINKINGHRYIGKTNNIERRHREHRSKAYNQKIINTSSDYMWYKKIRQYGWENFDFEILEVANENNWKEREQYWISYYNTWKGAGYNETPGGDGENNNLILDQLEVDNIYNLLLNSNIKQQDIAIEYNISQTLVSNINQGLRYRKDGYNFPLRKNYKTSLQEYAEVINLLQHSILTFKEIADKCNLCEATVKKINYGKMHYDENFNYPIRKFDSRIVSPMQRELIYHTELSLEDIALKHNKSLDYVKRINIGALDRNKLLEQIYSYPLRK